MKTLYSRNSYFIDYFKPLFDRSLYEHPFWTCVNSSNRSSRQSSTGINILPPWKVEDLLVYEGRRHRNKPKEILKGTVVGVRGWTGCPCSVSEWLTLQDFTSTRRYEWHRGWTTKLVHTFGKSSYGSLSSTFNGSVTGALFEEVACQRLPRPINGPRSF